MKILLTMIYVIVLITTVYWIIKKRSVSEDEVSSISETSLTWFIGVFIIIETAIVLYILWFYPERLVNSTASWTNTSIFIILGTLLGSYCLLFGFIKRTSATSIELIQINAFGTRKSINWNDIRDIERKGKTKLLFSTKSAQLTVQGHQKKYAKFIQDIEPYLNKKVLNKVLSQDI